MEKHVIWNLFTGINYFHRIGDIVCILFTLQRYILSLVLAGNSSLSASTLVTVQILDVNDNSPVLVGDYSWKYLCTPHWEDQALVLASRDSDGPQHGGRLNFSLRSDAAVRRNWKLTPINGETSNTGLTEFISI